MMMKSFSNTVLMVQTAFHSINTKSLLKPSVYVQICRNMQNTFAVSQCTRAQQNVLFVASILIRSAQFVMYQFTTMKPEELRKVSNVRCFGTTKLTLVCVLTIENFCAFQPKTGSHGAIRSSKNTSGL